MYLSLLFYMIATNKKHCIDLIALYYKKKAKNIKVLLLYGKYIKLYLSIYKIHFSQNLWLK